jgi:hypothetical protein
MALGEARFCKFARSLSAKKKGVSQFDACQEKKKPPEGGL